MIDGKRVRLAWVGYVLCTALAIYMSLMAVLIIPAQLIVLAWRRERIGLVGSTLPAIAVCCVPLMVLAARRGSGQLFWVTRPNWAGEKQVLDALTSSGLEPNIHHTATTTPLLVFTLFLVVAIAVLAARSRPGWPAMLVLAWLVVPVVLAWIESFVGQPIFLPRNLLMSVPAAALLLGWGLTRPRVPVLIALGSLGALIALRALQLTPSYGVSPEDWRGASAHVLARSEPGDCVAFYPSDGRQAFEYYLSAKARPRAPHPILPSAPFSEVGAYVEDYATLSGPELASASAGCRRLWFISSHQGQRDGPAGSRANLARFERLQAALLRAYPVDARRSFGYAAPVRVQLLQR